MSKIENTDMLVEVVMKKQVKLSEYRKMVSAAEQKGWFIRAYQVGFFSEGTKKKVG